MTYLSRPLSDPSDFQAMAALSNRYPSVFLRRTDLPYRFSSWALEDPENAHLWIDADGQVAAWAVMQAPFWTIDFAARPDVPPDLTPEVLHWADERARALKDTRFERPSWFVNVFADCSDQIYALKTAGFTTQPNPGDDEWSKVFMERDASAPVKDYRLPAGFKIRPLAGEREVAAYVELHQTTFETKNMTLEWRQRTLQHPDYEPELDLVVEAPDGRLGAFCIGWLNRHGPEPIGQIEPLGCHPDFRQYALGRLALAEALRRLRKAGAEKIFVETDNYRDTAMRLYESVGFQIIREVLVFRKDY